MADFDFKKVLLLFFVIILFFAGIIYSSYVYFSQEYKSCDCKILSIDDDNYALLDNGLNVSFRGKYYCSNGDYFTYDNYTFFEGKNAYMEFKLTDEGDYKVEKLSFDNVVCERGNSAFKVE